MLSSSRAGFSVHTIASTLLFLFPLHPPFSSLISYPLSPSLIVCLIYSKIHYISYTNIILISYLGNSTNLIILIQVIMNNISLIWQTSNNKRIYSFLQYCLWAKASITLETFIIFNMSLSIDSTAPASSSDPLPCLWGDLFFSSRLRKDSIHWVIRDSHIHKYSQSNT